MTQLRSSTHNKISIKKTSATWLFLVLLTFPHMNPAYLNQFPIWNTLLDSWTAGVVGTITTWICVSGIR